jgi:APAF-1 helical domain
VVDNFFTDIITLKLFFFSSILSILSNRNEYEFNNFSDDRYIYFNIGYHLKAAGRTELFPLLYLDFGFLEQKLRITGLPNTLGDFKTYKHEIFGAHLEQEEFRTELLEFLPDVEEFLFKSKDTCLLQYALTRSGLLREEAFKQAAMYPNRLWMEDK